MQRMRQKGRKVRRSDTHHGPTATSCRVTLSPPKNGFNQHFIWSSYIAVIPLSITSIFEDSVFGTKAETNWREEVNSHYIPANDIRVLYLIFSNH